MNFLPFIITAIVIVILLCLIVLIYFQIYKKNINKALSEMNKPKHMLEPYKLVFVLIVLLISASITVTSIAGLLYSNKYFQREKSFNSHTVYVNYLYENGSGKKVDSSDTERLKSILLKKYPNHNFDIIPIYTCMGVLMNGKSVNLFAVDEKFCSLLGLKEMHTDTAYSSTKLPNTVKLDISVTKIVEGGFESNKLEHLELKTALGVSEELLSSAVKQNSMPSMQEEPFVFVNMETFYEITSLLLDEKIESENDFSDYNELVFLRGIYVYSDRLSFASPVSTALSKENYNAYVLEDLFENFEKAISTTFKVFILSSASLVFLSAVNIYLTFRAIGKIKNKYD